MKKLVTNISKFFIYGGIAMSCIASVSAMDNLQQQLNHLSLLPMDMQIMFIEKLDYPSIVMLSQTSLYWRKLLVVGPFKKENAYLRRVIRNKKIAFETAQQQRADNLLQEISLLGSWYLRSFIQAVRTGILEIKQTDWEEDECTMPRPSGITGRILSIRSQSANVDHQSGRVLDSVQLQRFLRLVIRSGIIVETVTYSLNKKLPESQAALVATLLAHRHVTLSSSSSSTTSTTVDVTKSNVIEVMERHYFMIALKVACDAYAAKEPMGKRERRK